MSAATATKDRPILFSSEMVRAILAGRKTQTRRIVKGHFERFEEGWSLNGDHPTPWPETLCPYGKPGDRLWVRETWAEPASLCGVWCVAYKADGTARATIMTDGGEGDPVGIGGPVKPYVEHGVRWKASIHMPRWASRITLEITSVRVERLQAITEADARAEGISDENVRWLGETPAKPNMTLFSQLWEGINGPESWLANPFVWVISFNRVEAA